MRDYAKKSSISHASLRRSKKQSRWPMYIGMFLLMILLSLVFFQHKHKISQRPLPINLPVAYNKPHQLIAQHTKIKSNTSSNDLEYDFYQLLPKMTVEIPATDTSHR